MTDIQLTDVVTRAGRILSADTGAEVLAIDELTGNCFSLSGSGRLIWECAAEPITVDAICAQLRRRYRVDPATCAAETLAFVGRLAAEQMLSVERGGG